MFTATHLHAMIVHFPIALVFVAFVSEIAGIFLRRKFYQQASLYLLVLAALGAIAAFLTGDAAGDGMDGGSLKQAMELHEQAATLTLWLTIVVAITKIGLALIEKEVRWVKIIAFILLLSATGSVAVTGYLGGQLVFKYAAGVELGVGSYDTFNAQDNTNESESLNKDNDDDD